MSYPNLNEASFSIPRHEHLRKELSRDHVSDSDLKIPGVLSHHLCNFIDRARGGFYKTQCVTGRQMRPPQLLQKEDASSYGGSPERTLPDTQGIKALQAYGRQRMERRGEVLPL
jgi:hypothetical protein